MKIQFCVSEAHLISKAFLSINTALSVVCPQSMPTSTEGPHKIIHRRQIPTPHAMKLQRTKQRLPRSPRMLKLFHRLVATNLAKPTSAFSSPTSTKTLQLPMALLSKFTPGSLVQLPLASSGSPESGPSKPPKMSNSSWVLRRVFGSHQGLHFESQPCVM